MTNITVRDKREANKWKIANLCRGDVCLLESTHELVMLVGLKTIHPANGVLILKLKEGVITEVAKDTDVILCPEVEISY